MVGGRPKKRARNLTGLRNQVPSNSLESVTQSEVSSEREVKSESDDEDNITVAYDGLKNSCEEEYVGTASTHDSDIDEEMELDILNDEERGRKLAEMIEREGGIGPDWIPERLQRKKQKGTRSIPRPSTYTKGPDVMSKSKRTRQRYQKNWKRQQSLSSFGFTKAPHPRTLVEYDPGELAPTPGTDFKTLNTNMKSEFV